MRGAAGISDLTFSPRMQSHTQGFTVRHALKWRVWNGVVADVWDVDVATGAQGHYRSPDPRLFVVLACEGDGAFILSRGGVADVRLSAAQSLSYIPGEFAVQGRAEGITRIRHLDLHFNEAALVRRFGNSLDRDRLAEPRLAFADPAIAQIATLIAEECTSDRPMHRRYGEGLVDALMARLFTIVEPARRVRQGLTRRQLKLVTDYLEERSLEPFRLGDVAALAGLSQTHFSHAFKASTGLPPHSWHMQARVRRVQAMLQSTDMSLTEAAIASGFNDQAHFTRVFKLLVGTTPAAWRRALPQRKP